MFIDTNDSFPISISISIYRFLMAAYPKAFRQEYEADMLQVFRDCLLRDYGQDGPYGVFRLWAVTLLDLVVSMIEEHLQKETKIMNKNTLIRLSGWAMILGGIAYLMLFIPNYLRLTNPLMHLPDIYLSIGYISSLYVGTFLITAGLLGLRARYGEDVGKAGKNILLIAAIAGPAGSLIGIFGADLAPWSAYYGIGSFLWSFFLWGPIFQMISLLIFGILALRSGPLPFWTGLPILAGAGFPIFLLSYNGIWIHRFPWYLMAGVAIQFLAIIILGYTLQGNSQQKEPMAAAA